MTWNLKEVHFWEMNSGKRQGGLKIAEVSRSHTTISTIAFSHRFRLYCIVTADFRLFFLNENLNKVGVLDISEIRLVNFVVFNDKDEKVILAGIRGVFVYKFIYDSKYDPKLAATIDPEGKHIKLKLEG